VLENIRENLPRKRAGDRKERTEYNAGRSNA